MFEDKKIRHPRAGFSGMVDRLAGFIFDKVKRGRESGEDEQIEEIQIFWPDQTISTVLNIEVNQILQITKPYLHSLKLFY